MAFGSDLPTGSQAETTTIRQSERMFTVRGRNTSFNPNNIGDGGSRGTRAKIRILSSNEARTRNRASGAPGSEKLLNDLLSKAPGGFTDFLLTDVSVTYNEKAQINQTFGDTEVAYYFGKQPVLFSLSGVIVDDIDNGWFTQFFEAYMGFMRGTQLAQNYELLELELPNMMIVGSAMSFGYSQNSARETDVNFSMQVLAKSVIPIPATRPKTPVNNAAVLLNFGKAAGFKDFISVAQINSLKSKINGIFGAVQNPFASTSTITSSVRQLGSLGDGLGIGALSSFAAVGGGNMANLGLSGIGSLGSGLSGLDSGLTQNLPSVGSVGSFVNGSAVSTLGGIAGMGGPMAATLSSSGILNSLSGQIAGIDPTKAVASVGLSSTGLGGLTSMAGRMAGGLGGVSGVSGMLGGGASLPNGADKFISGGGIGGGLFGGNSTSIFGFKSSLFSPVYGILSSITKVVTSVTGSAASLISMFTNPVNTILRDIRGVAAQAIAVTKLVENSVSQLVNIPGRTINEFNSTIVALKNAAGVITRLPESISDTIKRLVMSGRISGSSAFLTSGGAYAGGKSALLNSGPPYTPKRGAFL